MPSPKLAKRQVVSLGRLVWTRGVNEWIADGTHLVAKGVLQSIRRHAVGDWGVVDAEDHRANDAALRNGTRILSAFMVEGKKIWIITEGDRSYTTVLFPDEY